MKRLALALAVAVAHGACAAQPDTAPAGFAGVDQSSLDGAELPAELATLAARPLAEGETGTAFVADPTLAADGTIDLAAPATTDEDHGQTAIVAIRWGWFPPRPGEGEWTDFSGFVAVSRGSVEVIKTLRFEDTGAPNGDFVKPDADPRIVRFRSHTRPAWDGLLLRVHRPRVAPTVLVLHVGDTTRVLPFEELRHLDAAETVDAAGHELRIRAEARAPEAAECAVQVGTVSGTLASGTLAGALDSGPTFTADTLDVRGPYALFRGVESEGGSAIGKLHGFAAKFHYSPGGALVGRLRSHDESARGVIVARFEAGAFDGRQLQRDPACAE